MDIRSFFLLFSVVGYVFVAYRIYHLNPKKKLNRLYALACLTFAIIGFVEYELLQATTLEDATFIYKVYNIYYLSRILMLYSVWTYAQMDKIAGKWSKIVFHLFNIVPPLLYFLSYLPATAIAPIKSLPSGGWTTYPALIPIKYWLGISWISMNTALTAFLYFITYRRATFKFERRINLSLAIFSALTTTLVLTANTVLHFKSGSTPIYTIPYILPFYVFIAWVFSNYRFFLATPQVAVDPILDAMSDLVILTDLDHKIIYINEAVSNLFDLNQEMILRKEVDDFFEIEGVSKKMSSLPLPQIAIQHYENIILKTKKHTKYLKLHVHTLGRKKIPNGYLYIGTDLTSYQNIMTQISTSNEKLKRSNQDLEQFIYIASHDLKEPLRMVNGFLHLLCMEHEKDLDQQGQQYIALAQNEAKTMFNYIEDLLQYAAIVEKKGSFSEINLPALFQNLQHKKALNFVLHAPIPQKIIGNKEQIQTLFIYLINKLNPTYQHYTIHISCTSQEHYWYFSVKHIIKKSYSSVFSQKEILHIHNIFCEKIIALHQGHFSIETPNTNQIIFTFTLLKNLSHNDLKDIEHFTN